MTSAVSREPCHYCGAAAPLSWWLPERYAVDNYSPSSFSGDELVGTCDACTSRYDLSHDPTKPRKKPRRPWWEKYDEASTRTN